MTTEDYFHQIFGLMPRQGPGSSDATRRAWLQIPSIPPHPVILDLGSGTGSQTRELASLSDGSITAVDIYEPFLDKITEWASREGLSPRIRTVPASMDDLPFGEESFDIIWSEGAIDIIGFENGLSLWKNYCKKGGYIVVSDLTLFSSPAPDELIDFMSQYGVTLYTEEEKVNQISNTGLRLLGSFRLEEEGWLEYFYRPMDEVLEKLRSEQGDNPECAEIIQAFEREGAMYQKYGRYYGYTFFVLQKP
jgi:ubiquinone/menaquinone biosynthesis C-methylase UbiE